MKNKTSYSSIITVTKTWGKWGKKFFVGNATKLICHCQEQGFTTFDHAAIYGSFSRNFFMA